MKIRPLFLFLVLVIGLFAATVIWLGWPVQAAPAPQPAAQQQNPPLILPIYYFMPEESGSRLSAASRDFRVWFEAERVTFELASGGIVTLEFLGSNVDSVPQGFAPITAVAHHYQGDVPTLWREDIPLYREVLYADLYPGIDLHYTFVEEQLKSEFIVHPGATLEVLQIHYSGIESLHLAEDALQIVVNHDVTLTEVIPYTYEELNGERRTLTTQFALLAPHTHGFRIQEARTPGATLVIDPELLYATYFGGTNGDVIRAITTDYEGNSYVAGDTWSPDLPVSDFSFPYRTNSDTFVAKFNPQGQLVYAIYYGGGGRERGSAIAVDLHGNAHVTGSTLSPDLPTLNAWQSLYGGDEDVYVIKVDPLGKLLWATYIGRTGPEEADAIAVDQLGRVYLAGEVYADDYPLLNPWCSTTYGIEDEDGFISILNPAGQLIYSTYVSAPQRDQLFSIAVDQKGHVYAAGMTSSPDFPVRNAVQPTYGGQEDCLILKLDPWQNTLHFATFLGGSDIDACRGIDFDLEGNVYVTGYTSSPDFPTVNAYQPQKQGNFDAFIAKLSPSGTALRYATHLGGADRDAAAAIITDYRGYAYIVGTTRSRDFPTYRALQPTHGGDRDDGFLAVFHPTGALHYASYIGGLRNESLLSVTLDGHWVAHIAGASGSDHLATNNAYQSQRAGGSDALVGRFAIIPTPTPTPTPTPFAVAEIGPAGGAVWLSYPKHLTLLQVPPGVLSDATSFELVYDGRPDLQGDLQGLDHFFRLGIDPPQNLMQPLLLTLGYQETCGAIGDTIMLYRLEGSRWVTSHITVEASSTVLLDQRMAWVTEPGIYGLLGQTNRIYLPIVVKR